MVKKFFVAFTIFIIVSITVYTNITVSADLLSQKNDLLIFSESYLIQGVPYVGQTGPYCYYASCTMIYKYYGVNTSESEVLFTTGVGHSLAYPWTSPGAIEDSSWTHYPVSGFALSQETDFICGLYNLSFHEWKPNYNNLTETEIWEQYWQRVKENITNDIPVITTPAPMGLTSNIRLFKHITNIPDGLLDMVANLFPGGAHAIVIVGFNESNQTICFNDPNPGFYDKPEYGTYAWMNLKNFSRLMKFYFIWTFKKTSSEPLNKAYIFEKVHQRNIQRMNGNASAYGTCIFYGDTAEKFNEILGINALKKYLEDLKAGLNNLLLIFYEYKKTGIKRHLLTTFSRIIPSKFIPRSILEMFIDDIVGDRQFKNIILDKQHASEVLWNYSYLSPIILEEAKLLNREIENWTSLQEYYSNFAKRGIFITIFRGYQIINEMSEIIGNIIEIEQKIIDNAS